MASTMLMAGWEFVNGVLQQKYPYYNYVVAISVPQASDQGCSQPAVL